MTDDEPRPATVGPRLGARLQIIARARDDERWQAVETTAAELRRDWDTPEEEGETHGA